MSLRRGVCIALLLWTTGLACAPDAVPVDACSRDRVRDPPQSASASCSRLARLFIRLDVRGALSLTQREVVSQ